MTTRADSEVDLMKMMSSEGIKVLDGNVYERDGVGFAGTKGFVGGFGRGVLTAFGEPEIKTFRARIDRRGPEAGARHVATRDAEARGGAPLFAHRRDCAGRGARRSSLSSGTSRLAEVVDRHGADLVVHGHAHHGTLDGKTTGGIPVHNVAITLLQAQTPPADFRIFDI